MKNNGFSLVELLIVIAIMAILAGVAVPVYSHFVDEAHKGKDNDYVAELFRMASVEAAQMGLEVEKIAVAIEDDDDTTNDNYEGRLMMIRFKGQTTDEDANYQAQEVAILQSIAEKTGNYEFKYDNYVPGEPAPGKIRGVYYTRESNGLYPYDINIVEYEIQEDEDTEEKDNAIKLPSISL